MARKIRIEVAGSAYHAMARGNQRRDIYADKGDCKLWLETLGEACEKLGGAGNLFQISPCRITLDSYKKGEAPPAE
jgi:hypothetical protein